MARKKKPSAATDAWGDAGGVDSLSRVPDEVPRARTIASKRSTKERIYRIIVWACVIAIPISGLMWLSTSSQMSGFRAAIASIPNPQSVDSPGKSTAFVAMEKWLALSPQPLVGGRIISWDGFQEIEKPKQTPEQAKSTPLPDYSFESHKFTLADSSGNLFTSAVQIAVGPEDAGSVAVGTPSLIAIPPSAPISVTSPWFGFDRTSAPKPVVNAVEAWATAFTSGDPEKLLLTVGDDDSNHSYMPLYNVSSVSSDVSFASYVPPADVENYVKGKPTGKMIAQVNLTITWKGAPPLGQGERNQTKITYDILVDRADTASPRVVAWGGPGSAPTLVPFGNALVGNDIKTTQGTGSTFVTPGDGSGSDGTSGGGSSNG